MVLFVRTLRSARARTSITLLLSLLARANKGQFHVRAFTSNVFLVLAFFFVNCSC